LILYEILDTTRKRNTGFGACLYFQFMEIPT